MATSPEIVSSEYLTMSGSKVSTSRSTVLYVGEFLAEYGPDALRYFMVNQAVGQQEWPDIHYGDGLGPLSQFL